MGKLSKITKLNREEKQFEYLGKWVNKEHFRAFVYNGKGEQQLAKSHAQFEQLISSGIWFASRAEASPPALVAPPVSPSASPKRKLKNDIALSNS